METNDSDAKKQNENDDRNANNAYSGSGSFQIGENAEEAGKLSDYPDGNVDENTDERDTTDSIPGNQTDQPAVSKTVDEATDPKKLSNL